MAPLSALMAFTLVTCALSREVPDNLRDFYDGIRARGHCGKKLATGFWSSDEDDSFVYCGDHLDDYEIIYIQGKKGTLANLDIDCDGAQGTDYDDGRCDSSLDTQSVTAFQKIVASYDSGISDLNANVHPYVVFGNSGRRRGWKTFDPEEYGVEPLSIMAVVCGDRLVYGVWGDTNGDDGEHPMVGEASIAVATVCFGREVTGNSGHDDDDVLYIAFVGEDAVPGAKGANWSATDFAGFEKSIEGRGKMLIERISDAAGDVAGWLLWGRCVVPLALALVLL